MTPPTIFNYIIVTVYWFEDGIISPNSTLIVFVDVKLIDGNIISYGAFVSLTVTLISLEFLPWVITNDLSDPLPIAVVYLVKPLPTDCHAVPL